jgi:hypothetical protein
MFSCSHRLPALSNTLLSVVALGFLVMAGMTCDLLKIIAPAGTMFESTQIEAGGILTTQRYDFSLGLWQDQCTDSGLKIWTWNIGSESQIDSNGLNSLSVNGDSLWKMCQYFWIASVIMGTLGLIIAVTLTLCMSPTDFTWRLLGFVAGVAAIVESPLLLVLLSTPCQLKEKSTDLSLHCQLSTGGIMVCISIVFWLTITILTQCLDAPNWGNHLNAWRVQKTQQDEERYQIHKNEDDLEGQSMPAKLTSENPQQRAWYSRSRFLYKSRAIRTSSTDAEDAELLISHDKVELMDQGSYYANSDSSRLMLKMNADGTRPGDDGKSIATFGDLEDMVEFSEQHRDAISLITPVKWELDSQEIQHTPLNFERSENCEENFDRSLNSIDEPMNIRIIEFIAPPSPTAEILSPPTTILLENSFNEKPISTLVSTSRSPSNSPPVESRQTRLSSIQAMTNRIRRKGGKKTKNGARYASLGDEDSYDEGNSDADIEDETDGCQDVEDVEESLLRPKPEAHQDEALNLNHISQPTSMDPRDQELLHDWNALHAAATAGVLLTPKNIAIQKHTDVSERHNTNILPESESQSDHHGFEDSASEISLYSNAEPQEDEENGHITGSSVSSDSSNDEGGLTSKQTSRIRHRRRRTYSAANSVASRTSLLDITIEEETSLDLDEKTSDEEYMNSRKLSQGYALRGVKSAPDRMSFLTNNNGETKSSAITNDLHHVELACVSEDSDSEGMDSHQEKMKSEEENAQEKAELMEDGPLLPLTSNVNQLRRGRCRSTPRLKLRSVHPDVSPPRGKSAGPQFRMARIEKAGIHSPHIHVVSDDDDDDSSQSDLDNTRDFRSNASQKARSARLKRLHKEQESRQRSRSVGSPITRKQYRKVPPKPEVVVFDPTLRAILVTRKPGTEYGPDEASL